MSWMWRARWPAAQFDHRPGHKQLGVDPTPAAEQVSLGKLQLSVDYRQPASNSIRPGAWPRPAGWD